MSSRANAEEVAPRVLPALGAAVDDLVARVALVGADAGSDLPDMSGVLPMLVEVTSAIGRLQGVQVVLAEAVAGLDVVGSTGWASVKDLVTHLAGGRKGTGGGIVRLAEQTALLPQVRAAMLTGEVSPAQARVISRRVTTLPADPELRVQAAGVMLGQVRDRCLDATDLDRAFGDVLSDIDPDGSLLGQEEERRAVNERGGHEARHLALVPDEVGGVRIIGYAGIEDAEIIRTTLGSLSAPMTTQPGACGGDPSVDWAEASRRRRAGQPVPVCPDPCCGHDGRDPREHGVRMLDALVELCRRAQAVTGDDSLPRDHGASARITVTIDHETLLDQLGDGQLGTGLLGSGQRLTVAAVRRLACDAEILPAVLGSGSQVLDLGRAQRLVTPGLWQAVVLRDRHCTFPGCTRLPSACEAHHVTHWAQGGPTSLDNLALLCRAHHTLTHHSPWQVRIDPDTRRPVWRPPPPQTGPLPFTHVYPTSPDPPAPPAARLRHAS